MNMEKEHIFIFGFDESAFKNIAIKSNSMKAKRDVNFFRIVAFKKPKKLVAIRYKDIGGVLAYHNTNDTRIVMTAIDEKYKKQGIGKALVNMVIAISQKEGKERVYTVTKDGVGFYSSIGFQTIGKKNEEYILEKRWKK